MANQYTKRRENKAAFLETAIRRFNDAAKAEADVRKEALYDFRFRAGEQWDPKDKRAREAAGRPCLTINRLPQFIRQVTNDQRQNRPEIKVNPVDDGADVETAKVLQGLCRSTEYISNADVAYDTAFAHAATGGFGYWRVITEYCDPLSFDQDVKIQRIRNPFSVFIDPAAREADASDMRWAFIVEDMPRDEFEAQYPDSETCDKFNEQAVGLAEPGWVDKDTVRVAEYFWIEQKSVRLILLADGKAYTADQVAAIFPEGVPEEMIKDSRKTQVPQVKWAKITAAEILEETDWPGRWIPIVPTYGDELEVDGKRILEGVTRQARDPMKMYNYWATKETEAIAMAPNVPWLMPAGADEGFEKEWKASATQNLAVLHYHPVVNGQQVPPPSRVFTEPAVAAITNARMQASDDLKATTGIYDAALGARSNENSGVAIRARANQGQVSNFHLIDNLSRAIRHTGRILIDLYPKIYDTERIVRIVGEDGEQKTVWLNREFEQDGEKKLYRLDAGKYDVQVQVGPSYGTRRQEAAAAMQEMVRAVPQLMQVAGDLMIKAMDWPGAKELSERMKVLLPPEVKQSETKDKGEDPMQLRSQIGQMGGMIEQLTQALNQAQANVAQAEQSVAEAQAKLTSKEAELQIKGFEAQTKAELEAQKLQIEEAKLALDAQKLQLESQKLDLEKMRIIAESMQNRSEPVEGEVEAEDPEHQEPEGMTREDLALMFQAQVAAMQAASQPIPPMPPQVIRLTSTPEGMVGVVAEAPTEEIR